MNVALTLAPALSALAMFVLLQRWVSWAPASFAGGLFYGFSPYVLVSLADAHLMLGMAFVPPLVVACLDELLFRRRRRPVVTGVVLGLLVTVQFFIGTEVLVIMAIMAALGIAIVAVAAAGQRRPELGAVARRAGVGLATAAVTAGVLLAYPAWYALAGPAHLSGLVWPHFHPAYGGNQARAFLLPTPALSTGFFGSVMRPVVGGSQGPILSSQYFGIGTAVVVVAGTLIWRRDRRLWLFDALIVVSVVLSLGARHKFVLPWQAVARLPLLENISASRFVLITYLAVAACLGIIVDHCRTGVLRRRQAGRHAHAGGPPGTGRRWGAALAGTAVALVALVPSAVYLSTALPFTTRAVQLPTWFTRVAPHLARQAGPADPPRPLRRHPDGHDLAGRRPDGLLHGRTGRARRGGRTGRAGGCRPVGDHQCHVLLQPHPGHHRAGRGGRRPGPARMGGHHGGRPRPTRAPDLRADPIGDRRRGADDGGHRHPPRPPGPGLGVDRGRPGPGVEATLHCRTGPVHGGTRITTGTRPSRRPRRASGPPGPGRRRPADVG